MNNKKINLLPAELSVPADTMRIIKVFNKISVFSVILLIIVTLLVTFLFVFFSDQYKKVNASVETLTNEISLLQKSEQKLFFVKKRLGEIADVKSSVSVEKDIVHFKSLDSSVSSITDSKFADVEIKPGEISTALSLPDSDTFSAILELFSNLKDYQKVIMSSLGFSSGSGFSSSFVFANKYD